MLNQILTIILSLLFYKNMLKLIKKIIIAFSDYLE